MGNVFISEVHHPDGTVKYGTHVVGGASGVTPEQVADHIHRHDLYPWAKKVVVRESNARRSVNVTEAIKAAAQNGGNISATADSPMVTPDGPKTPRPEIGEPLHALSPEMGSFPTDAIPPSAPDQMPPLPEGLTAKETTPLDELLPLEPAVPRDGAPHPSQTSTGSPSSAQPASPPTPPTPAPTPA